MQSFEQSPHKFVCTCQKLICQFCFTIMFKDDGLVMYLTKSRSFLSLIHCGNFVVCSLRDRAQVEQLLHYVIEEPSSDIDNKRTFKYVYGTKSLILCLQIEESASCFLILFLILVFVSNIRFPFIACEIFTCEIDVILKTLVEEEEVSHQLVSVEIIEFKP